MCRWKTAIALFFWATQLRKDFSVPHSVDPGKLESVLLWLVQKNKYEGLDCGLDEQSVRCFICITLVKHKSIDDYLVMQTKNWYLKLKECLCEAYNVFCMSWSKFQMKFKARVFVVFFLLIRVFRARAVKARRTREGRTGISPLLLSSRQF